MDQHPDCIRFISQTATALSLPITVVKMNVLLFLKQNNNSYEFIFADPPYVFELTTYKIMINIIFEKNILSHDGLLIVEHAEQVDLFGVFHD